MTLTTILGMWRHCEYRFKFIRGYHMHFLSRIAEPFNETPVPWLTHVQVTHGKSGVQTNTDERLGLMFPGIKGQKSRPQPLSKPSAPLIRASVKNNNSPSLFIFHNPQVWVLNPSEVEHMASFFLFFAQTSASCSNYNYMREQGSKTKHLS